jgi:hypothetical protein
MLYMWALSGNEMHLGGDHPGTLTMMDNIGNVYRIQGRYDEAEELLKRVCVFGSQQLLPTASPNVTKALLSSYSASRHRLCE